MELLIFYSSTVPNIWLTYFFFNVWEMGKWTKFNVKENKPPGSDSVGDITTINTKIKITIDKLIGLRHGNLSLSLRSFMPSMVTNRGRKKSWLDAFKMQQLDNLSCSSNLLNSPMGESVPMCEMILELLYVNSLCSIKRKMEVQGLQGEMHIQGIILIWKQASLHRNARCFKWAGFLPFYSEA